MDRMMEGGRKGGQREGPGMVGRSSGQRDGGTLLVGWRWDSDDPWAPVQVADGVGAVARHGGEVPPGPAGAPEGGQDQREEGGRGQARHRSKRLHPGPPAHPWGVL